MAITYTNTGGAKIHLEYVEDIDSADITMFRDLESVVAELLQETYHDQRYVLRSIVREVIDSLFTLLGDPQPLKPVGVILDCLEELEAYSRGVNRHQGHEDDDEDDDELSDAEAAQFAHGSVLVTLSFLTPEWVVERAAQ